MSSKNNQYPLITDEYATVIAVHTPLIRARGFTTVKSGEVVVFDSGAIGQVLSFDEKGIDIMVFSNESIPIHSSISRTNTVLSFPIHHLEMGQIYSPLGELLVGDVLLSPTKEKQFKPLYSPPPRIPQRKRITTQLETGYNLTDILLPLGHGQRELLVGDRKAGKSDFARGMAAHQAKLGNTVVYCLIGKKISDIKRTYEFFAKQKLLSNVVLIASTAQDPVSTISITPTAAMSVAESLISQGKTTILILDDLTSHAEFYREISLLAKRFPGRDSYPGDIFHVHAHMLERSGCFVNPMDSTKTVALSCLPVVRTSNGDLTDFITSNLISITDGHLLFDTKLYAQGYRPAINTSLSVTRVGKQTQTPLQRELNQQLTSFLSAYRKTKNLTHLGTEISDQSQAILKKGDLFTTFLSDANQTSIPHSAKIILVGMIWEGWFNQTHENELKSAGFKLGKALEIPQTATQITAILDTHSFTEFLEKLRASKNELRELCQI